MSVPARLVVLLALVVSGVLAGCASVAPLETAVRHAPPPPSLRFGADTFAFPNESRSKNQGKPDLYANYCFVMARAVSQFLRFARFEPGEPPLSPAEYAERVRRVAARAPWTEPLPASERVVIPGYASLFDLSRAQEGAVKDGLGGRFWTLVHWTNWRTTMPVPDGHQEAVLHEVIAELAAGRLVQLLVTNWPKPELNHTVVAYGYLLRPAGAELTVWDPNDLSGPGTVVFDARADRFVAAHVYETWPGPIRVFRMYYSWLL
jgi:hypothetical protein